MDVHFQIATLQQQQKKNTESFDQTSKICLFSMKQIS